ncbi:MAG: hypothetical protein M1834_008652 [Cirrosporium novae-zelandiae]|nr:MAG: hypothetical protein M1834_008652 [Cirrosporium novae-zelandiae]
MAGRLLGKIAIVTGGASGFGHGIARKFVNEGAKVMLADLNSENGEKVRKELDCKFVKANVSMRADWEHILKTTVDAYGGIDIIVNNAGACYQNKPTIEVTDEDYDLCMNVNTKSLFLSTSVILPHLMSQNRGGVFIQISSTSATKRPRPGLTWYSASKAAIVTASKSMAVEYAPQQIRFNCISPVVGGTGMTHLFLGKPDTLGNRKAFMSTIPMGRFSTPEDVGNAACYLASNEAAFVTGVELEVDGGRCV